MKNNKINQKLLEQYILGELPGPKMEEIKRRLEEDPVLKTRVEELINSNNEILKQYPQSAIVPEILSRYELEKRKEKISAAASRPVFFKRLLAASPAFALVILLLFIAWPFQKEEIALPVNEPVMEKTRIKGSNKFDMTKPHLLLHRKNNRKVELLKNGDKAVKGDLLQLAYVPAGQVHGVIFSIDGGGVVTLHHPEGKNKSTALAKGKKILLPNAYELDNAPEFERFFFITSSYDINVDEILQSAQALAKNPKKAKQEKLDIKKILNQYSILIVKGE